MSKIRFIDVVRALLPFIFYQEDDGTFSPVDGERRWQVGNETFTEQELVDAVNEEVKRDDGSTDD